MANGNLE